MTPIAVTLLTGFLGAGKTTLLRHILNEQHGFKIAVIENEFGEVSVDDQLIGDRATQIKTLTNGCICCTRSNELEDALLDLLDSRGWSYVPPVKAVRPISATATRNCRWARSSPEKPAASVTGKSICYAPAS